MRAEQTQLRAIAKRIELLLVDALRRVLGQIVQSIELTLQLLALQNQTKMLLRRFNLGMGLNMSRQDPRGVRELPP